MATFAGGGIIFVVDKALLYMLVTSQCMADVPFRQCWSEISLYSQPLFSASSSKSICLSTIGQLSCSHHERQQLHLKLLWVPPSFEYQATNHIVRFPWLLIVLLSSAGIIFEKHYKILPWNNVKAKLQNYHICSSYSCDLASEFFPNSPRTQGPLLYPRRICGCQMNCTLHYY